MCCRGGQRRRAHRPWVTGRHADLLMKELCVLQERSAQESSRTLGDWQEKVQQQEQQLVQQQLRIQELEGALKVRPAFLTKF